MALGYVNWKGCLEGGLFGCLTLLTLFCGLVGGAGLLGVVVKNCILRDTSEGVFECANCLCVQLRSGFVV